MIKYEGEWFWGVDRLYVLEARLVEEGLSRDAAAPLCVPRPELPMTTDRDTSQIVVEVYPSLRSPYTAISFDRTVEMVEALGAKLVLKPVMPMMMRGVPAPRAKQLWIISDAGREARASGIGPRRPAPGPRRGRAGQDRPIRRVPINSRTSSCSVPG